MTYMIWTHVAYGIAAVVLTAVLARTLFSHGALFLESVFEDNVGMAAAVNRLLVTGFYMLNLGYALLLFRSNEAQTTLQATELLVTKLGVLLLSLGIIHFINMAVFWKIRRYHDNRNFTPAMPSVTVPPPPTGKPVPFNA